MDTEHDQGDVPDGVASRVGRKTTVNKAIATMPSRITTTIRHAMPNLNSDSEAVICCAVPAASSA